MRAIEPGEPTIGHDQVGRASARNLAPGHRASRRRGFTLIELVVVIAILALIASFAAPQVFKFLGDSNTKAAKVQIANLSAGIDLYKLEVGSFPESLEALIERPAGAERWNGPYLRKRVIPLDPWGNAFRYRYPGQNGPYDLVSLGADNVEGGDGENRDVVSWE